MRKKAPIGILFTLLLTNIAMLTINIQAVEATETIYIQADGSIDPPTAPIQRDGDVYTFTGYIYDSIWVLRDSIVIDGAGYTLQGTSSIIQGIRLAGRTDVTVQNIQIKNFQNGIVLSDSSSNISISGNTITNTNYGIRLMYSSSNSISGNNITNIYYGIQLEYSSNLNSISENNIIANTNSGIVLSSSSNNIISGNNIVNNGQGIALISSAGNRIYHNNFIDNPQQAYSPSSTNMWDDGYPSGGNFWSNYNGIDLNGDGIGDTAYEINANNTDRYPLIVPVVWNFLNPVPVVWEGAMYPVAISSNSSISMFKFNQPQMQISFTVTGTSGTVGYCNVTILKSLLSDSPWTVTINGQPPMDFVPTSNDTHNFLYFTYTHASTLHVVIQGTHVIPEFPAALILPLFMTLSAIAVVFAKKKRRKQKVDFQNPFF